MNLKVNYNNSQVCSITEGSVVLDTTNKYANSNTTVKADDFSFYISEHAKILKKPIVLTKTEIYTGSYISNGYSFLEGITVTGDTGGTIPGTYVSTYTPNTGYIWDDGTQDTVTITLAIYLDYLCFTANAAGSTVKCPQAFEYSTNRVNWTTASTASAITITNTGDKIYLRNGNVGTPTAALGTFTMTGSVAASGNIMSLVDNTCVSLTIPCDNCFYAMFKNCTSLTMAPDLPATTLANKCYFYMFYGCTSLTTAPALPAITLTTECYQGMFNTCTSLLTTPSLPATTLADRCYYYMFFGCTSLAVIPALPAITLANACYEGMFGGCSTLIVSSTSGTGYNRVWVIPLSGTFTSSACQFDMFYGCAKGSGRSSDNMAGDVGKSYIYYTQNPPV